MTSVSPGIGPAAENKIDLPKGVLVDPGQVSEERPALDDLAGTRSHVGSEQFGAEPFVALGSQGAETAFDHQDLNGAR